MSHARLLDQAASADHGGKPIMEAGLVDRLRPYLAFRHVFRHAYAFDLNWKKMEPLVRELRAVDGAVDAWLASIESTS